ncbi:hypothetical protein AOLI_G00270920 [Acnodon oligacanthus]
MRDAWTRQSKQLYVSARPLKTGANTRCEQGHRLTIKSNGQLTALHPQQLPGTRQRERWSEPLPHRPAALHSKRTPFSREVPGLTRPGRSSSCEAVKLARWSRFVGPARSRSDMSARVYSELLKVSKLALAERPNTGQAAPPRGRGAVNAAGGRRAASRSLPELEQPQREAAVTLAARRVRGGKDEASSMAALLRL